MENLGIAIFFDCHAGGREFESRPDRFDISP